jgi:hypothetical protein|tara:strand:+ start:5517 stop:6776 length:1260 start_codon:yes stop_codon:yes gene_type:complete
MSLPTLTPASTLSAVVLPITGSTDNVDTTVPYRIYSDTTSPLYSSDFIAGAVDQVSYVYKKLGGDILDIELTEGNVYAAYEESCLEYSYLINVHQATNILSDALGNTTGSFDSKGVLQEGALSSSLGRDHVALKYPKFDYSMSRRIADGIGSEVGLNASIQYTASFDITVGQQNYDLQQAISTSEAHSGSVGDKRILIKKVYYKTPHAMWRFFGYYGGLNVVGNLSNYGQFSDDSTFQLIPTWQNKSQALAFEDAIYTRLSHYSYELKNNNIRLYPIPYTGGPKKMYVEFSVRQDIWTGADTDLDGVNNMNTLPIGNLPFNNINAIGKQWIRRFALALSKETLGQVRSKFGSVPVPGQTINLNGTALIAEGKDEQEKLREELKATLAEMTYNKLAELDAGMADSVEKVLDRVPNYIFVG